MGLAPRYVTLYHGTSSALKDNILKEGIKPPDEELEKYTEKIAKYYFSGQVPDEVQKHISDFVIGFRSNRKDIKLSNVIYLSTDVEEAKLYARSYAKTGGEIAFEIYRFANYWHCKQKNIDVDEKCIDPIYPNATPIVIEVEIPYDWVLNKGKLLGAKDHVISTWDKFPNYHDSIEEFLDEIAFEVTVEEIIPKSMIKKIFNAGEE